MIEKEIIENYLLYRLNEMETDDFEEHLLYCEECRKLLAETKEVITLTQYMAIHNSTIETKKVAAKKSVMIYRPWMKAAAVLLVIICSSAIIWRLLQNPTESLVRNESKSNPNKNILDSTQTDDTKPVKTLSQPALLRKDELLSDSYKELALYENAIKNNLRGESIDIISPKISSYIALGEKVVFLLKDNKKEILLTVINNSGEILFENRVQIPYTLQLKLQRGLYYWEITENEEVIFVSKFLIR